MTKTVVNMNTLNPTFNQAVKNQFNGGAIIDEFGNETPISETMIQHACSVLANSWESPSIKQQGYTLKPNACNRLSS